MIATPHLGANTMEAQKRVAVEIAEQFVDVVNGKSLFGAVSIKFQTSSSKLMKSLVNGVFLGYFFRL